jgi:superfamily I DNA/RNA helicase
MRQKISMAKKQILTKGREKMSAALMPLSGLAPDRLKVVELPLDRNWLVLGSAGSGKTQVLIHRASHLAKTYGISPDKFRIFVFTEMAREYISPAVQFLGLPQQTVTTFDNWCRLFYEEHKSSDLPRTYINLRVDFQRIRAEVLLLLEQKKELRNILEFALVDDGQDLAPEIYEILKLAARRVNVFADFKQKIAESGISEPFILETLGLKRRVAKLWGTYRNAPYVANLASYFIADKEARRDYLSQITARQKVKEHPLCYISPDLDKEISFLAATVQMRQSMNEKVGIIVPSSSLLHELTKELKKRGVEVEKVIERDAQNIFHEPFNFGNNIPKIATYHTAKGLAFDSVFLPNLTENSFSAAKGEARQRMVFVGIARASQWVYLSTIKGSEFKEIKILKNAEADGHLLMI